MEIEMIIQQTVEQMILKLKSEGIIAKQNKTAFQKTEELLKHYKKFKKSEQPYTKRITVKIESAMNEIKSDPYFKLISMFYFQGLSRYQCARYFNTTETTISRNKTRLVNELKTYLFSDEVIEEIFLNRPEQEI